MSCCPLVHGACRDEQDTEPRFSEQLQRLLLMPRAQPRALFGRSMQKCRSIDSMVASLCCVPVPERILEDFLWIHASDH